MTAVDGAGALTGRAGDAARLVAGLADFGLDQAEGLLRRARGALGRHDYADLAAEAHTDLLARGEVVLARLGSGGGAHMEALARIAQRTRDARGSGGGDEARDRDGDGTWDGDDDGREEDGGRAAAGAATDPADGAPAVTDPADGA